MTIVRAGTLKGGGSGGAPRDDGGGVVDVLNPYFYTLGQQDIVNWRLLYDVGALGVEMSAGDTLPGPGFKAALTATGAVAWGGPLLGSAQAQMIVAAPGATRLASGAHRLVVLDANGQHVHLSAALDARTHHQSAAGTVARTVTAPHSNCRLVDVGGGGSLFATISAEGEVFVFGEAGALVPVPSVSGVVGFTAGPAHLLAVDSAGRLCRLCAALQSTSCLL